jgi:hypothetical protein
MMEPYEPIVVGVLGQWASGKTVAARTLVDYLGGEEETIFITDRELISSQAVDHMLELSDAEVTESYESDGRKRLESEHVAIWLYPGEDLESVDLERLEFSVDEFLVPEWHRRARAELGRRICAKLDEGWPIVLGPDGRTLQLTISDLFLRLAETGLPANQINWIVVEANYEKRAERNRRRKDTIPADVFDFYALDGGDLNPDQQGRFARQGAIIRRVANNHDTIDRFRADVVVAFESITGTRRDDFAEGQH